MKRILEHSENIVYLDLADDISENNGNYIIATSDPDDTQRIKELSRHGFIFLDRTLLETIETRKLNDRLLRMIRYDVSEDDTFTDDVFDLAKRTFEKDRRFHLKPDYDKNDAAHLIDRYIKYFETQESILFKCKYKEQLAGFIIISNLGSSSCENVLGAVAPEFQSRGAAVSLYVYMVKALREKGFEQITGRISTKNSASLNLHILLGATFSKPLDTYIKSFL